MQLEYRVSPILCEEADLVLFTSEEDFLSDKTLLQSRVCCSVDFASLPEKLDILLLVQKDSVINKKCILKNELAFIFLVVAYLRVSLNRTDGGTFGKFGI